MIVQPEKADRCFDKSTKSSLQRKQLSIPELYKCSLHTVNVDIFVQYILSRMVSDTRKYDVSENLNHYRLNGIMYKMCKNMSTRKCYKGLDARKFSSANISTFTVV